MRKCTNRTFAKVVGAAAILIGAFVLAPPSPAVAQETPFVPLADYVPDTAQPTDGANAQLDVAVFSSQMNVALWISALDPQFAGSVLGAKLHTGPCIGSDPAAAGSPFIAIPSGPTQAVQTEVWLNVEIGADGSAFTSVDVTFENPPLGAQSMVFFDGPIGPNGETGLPWACLTVPWLSDEEIRDRIFEASGLTAPQEEVLGLAITGPTHTELLAIAGIALIASGTLMVRTSTTYRRRRA